MTILSRLKRSGVNAEAGNRPYVSGDDYPTQMRKRTQKAVNDISPQVQSELVRPYKQPSYEEHEYYQVPPPGIDWEPRLPEPLPLPSFRIPTPVFAPSSGTYTSTQTLSITAIAGADIYYTTDGRAPNEHSRKYVVPIQMEFGVTYNARAFKEGWDPSNIATAKYVSLAAWSLVKAFTSIYPAEMIELHVPYAIGYDSTSGALFLGTSGDYVSSSYPSTAHIWKSSDGGITWVLKKVLGPPSDPVGTPNEYSIEAFIHDSINNLMFACGSSSDPAYGPADAYLWKSSDGGETWTAKLTDTEPGQFACLAHDTTNDILLCASSDGIYKSTDQGESWTLKTAIQARAMVYDSVDDIFISVNFADIYKSDDLGETWVLKETLAEGIFNGNCISYDQTNNVIIIGTTTNGEIYKSNDAGETWTLKHTISGDDIESVLCDPSSGSYFVGTYDGMLYISTDQGESWTLEKDFSLLEGGYPYGINGLVSDLTNSSIFAIMRSDAPISEYCQVWKRG